MSILLSEGSSLTARETVSALGPRGHRIGVCDPDPLCLARVSRYVSGWHRVPPVADDPAAYVRAVAAVAERERYEVLLPVHEQVAAFAALPELLPVGVAVALPPFDALCELIDKASFSRLLSRLRLPQPQTAIHDRLSLPRTYPYYVKRALGTAGQAVWRVGSGAARAALLDRLDGEPGPFVVQAEAPGVYCQAQAVCDRGHVVALHCSQARAVGMGGSAAARVGVHDPDVVEHVERLAGHLDWHGALTLDYIRDPSGPVRYIEANPRLVEPFNAAASGADLAQLLVDLSAGRHPAAVPTRGIRSHGLIAVLMGTADRSRSRRAVARVLVKAALRRDPFSRSAEALTPAHDPPSALALAYVAVRLLASPRSAAALAAGAVRSYSLGAAGFAALRPAARSATVSRP